MMNLAIDYGNTRIKAGLFNGHILEHPFIFENVNSFEQWSQTTEFENVIVSSVAHPADQLLNKIECEGKKIELTSALSLPIVVKYKTPETLGVDRIAAACGAHVYAPKQSCLIVDLGTCINYEFIDVDSNYLGGAISPGIKMRFEAMHTFTARLPLVDAAEKVPLIGDNTIACMQSGVMNGIQSEITGLIDSYRLKYPNMAVILCGGDAHFFENNMKQPIFVAPNLVLSGLNRILLHHVNF